MVTAPKAPNKQIKKIKKMFNDEKKRRVEKSEKGIEEKKERLLEGGFLSFECNGCLEEWG